MPPILGRTIAELATPISELANPLSPMMPPVQEFDAELLTMERTLQETVPEVIRQRVRVTRDLAVYGSFCYDFFVVSASWAYSTIEMALWTKFKELNPANPTPPAAMSPLVEWAIKQKLLPPHLLPPYKTIFGHGPGYGPLLADVRNSLMHPRTFNQVHSPDHAANTFETLIAILNTLWPVVSTEARWDATSGVR
ncbi:MAG TPA: hypothetical protein VHZ74_18245 [Bryobacteraceae bacterium]|jgi:hypothetical protein|nr:hypothetical protein [Bryobacteraceae bacterium]